MPTWRRTFWIVWGSNLITALGMMSFLPFFPSYIEHELGVSDPAEVALWTGVVFGAAPLVAALLAPVWGVLGDRLGRKLMIMRALCAITLFVGSMGFVTAPWQLLGLRILQGCFSGFIAPSVTLVSSVAPTARQGRVAGDLQTALAAGSVVGPLLGAVIRRAFGMRAVFLVVALAALVSLILVGCFVRDEVPLREAEDEAAKRRGLFATMRRDLGELRRLPRLRLAVTLVFALFLGVGATQPQMELFVAELLPDADALRVGEVTALLLTLFSLASLVAAPLWGRIGDRRGHLWAMRWALVAAAIVLALHAPVLGLVPLIALRIAIGAASSGAGPSAYGMAARDTPADGRGGAFGLVFSARALSFALGAMSGGLIAGWLGIRNAFALGALLIGAGAVIAFRAAASDRSGPEELGDVGAGARG